MNRVKSIPDGVSAIIPMLVCQNPSLEINFCKTVFNAIEIVSRPGEGDTVAHAALRIDGAMIMIEAETPSLASRSPKKDGSSPVIIYLYVDNVDQVIERALTAGGGLIVPARDQFWGDRTGRIIDPSGHVWILSSRIEETSAEERTERWDKILKGLNKDACDPYQ